MVVKKGGTNCVFLEELDHRFRRGRIVVVEIDASGVHGGTGRARYLPPSRTVRVRMGWRSLRGPSNRCARGKAF
jgi:hypothetical protein